MRYLLFIILAFMPSALKIVIYRMCGAKIGKNVYIGLSVLQVENLVLCDHTYIGHLNLIWRIKNFNMDVGSRVNIGNWITGAKVGNISIGKNSAITTFHFIEGSCGFEMGDNGVIAGRGSQFFTHGIAPNNLDVKLPIILGDWCYVGSASRFTPGSGIASRTFVGMGAVVTKLFEQPLVVIGGCPAKMIRRLSEDEQYFDRTHMPHIHHPKNYIGN